MCDEFRQALKKLGMKATPRRLALLKTLAESPIYLSPEEVWTRLKESCEIGLPTVYRNLEELAEGGLLSKVLHPDRKLYYYFCRNNARHHHFICVSCRKVEDIDVCLPEMIDREVGKAVKGKVLSHIFQVEGLCENCCNGQEAKDV